MKLSLKMSISTWLILPITLWILIVLTVTYFVTIERVQNQLFERTKIALGEQTKAVAWHLEAGEALIGNAAVQGASRLGQSALDEEGIRAELVRTIEHSRGAIYSATYAPVVSDSQPNIESYYLSVDDVRRGAPCRKIPLSRFDYRSEEWYKPPLLTLDIAWSQPYYTGMANDFLMTCSVPVYKNQKVIAILAVDVKLDWLKRALENVDVNYEGYVSLFSLNGRAISYRKTGTVGRFVDSYITQKENPAHYEILQRAEQGEGSVVSYKTLRHGDDALLAFSPIDNTHWSVAILAKKEAIEDEAVDTTHKVMFLVILGVGLMLVIVIAIARSISRSISQLDLATQVISNGDIWAPLPFLGETTSKEITQLKNSFERMQSQLILHMEALDESLKVKQLVEGELVAAHQIQMSLVPKVFPPFPDKPRLDLYALLEPARDIGGDLYDYFLLEEEELCIIIGDVSGKGIPAALFMAITRSYLRSFWRSSIKIEDVLAEVNNQLTVDNENMMFVTLFCARLNLWTGKMSYVNAGHNSPLLARQGEDIQSLPVAGDPMLGVFSNTKFRAQHIQLLPGDSILFFTDGANEAMDVDDVCLGEAALKECFNRARGESAMEITRAIRERISLHAVGAVQNDDITLMVLKILEKKIELPEWMPKIKATSEDHARVFSK